VEVSLVLRLVNKMQEGLSSAKKQVQDFGKSVENAFANAHPQEAAQGFNATGDAAERAGKRAENAFSRARRNVKDFFAELKEETTAGHAWAAKGRFGEENLKERLKSLTENARTARNEFLKFTAMAAPLAGMAHQAAKFDQSVKEFEKVTTNMSEARLSELKNFAVNTSQQVAFSAEQMLMLMKAAVQNGIADKDIERFSLFAARTGIAFDMAAEDVSSALAKLKNSYGKNGLALGQDQIEDLADAFNYLANNTASSAKELMDFTQRASSVSGTMKMSPLTVAAVGSAMVARGMPAEVAGTAFGTLGARIMAGGKPVRKGFAALGIDREQFIKDFAKDEQGTILLLFRRIRELGDKGQEALIGIAGGQQFKNLAKLDDSALSAAFKQINNKAARKDSVKKEADRQMSGAEMQFALLQNRLKALSVTIGTELLPPILAFLDKAGAVINSLTAWAHEHPKTASFIIQSVGALAAFNVALKSLKWLLAGAELGIWKYAANLWKFDEMGKNVAARRGLIARLPGFVRSGIGGLAAGTGILGGVKAAGSAGGASAAGGAASAAGGMVKGLLRGGVMAGATIGVDIANDFLQASSASAQWKSVGGIFADTVNAAMLGFIAGGPWGAAIAALGAAVYKGYEAYSKTPYAFVDSRAALHKAEDTAGEQAEAVRKGAGYDRALLERVLGKSEADYVIGNKHMTSRNIADLRNGIKEDYKKQIDEFTAQGGKIAADPQDAINRGYDPNDPALVYSDVSMAEQTELGKKLGSRGRDFSAVTAALAERQKKAAPENILEPIAHAPGEIPLPAAGNVTNSNNTVNQTITIKIEGSADPAAVGRAAEAALRQSAAAALHGGGQ